jgi:hypothetical protein
VALPRGFAGVVDGADIVPLRALLDDVPAVNLGLGARDIVV